MSFTRQLASVVAVVLLSSAAQAGPDCNGNGIPDDQDIANGAPDCNTNGIPDDCETLQDSDGDGTPDCYDGCPKNPALVNPGICGCDEVIDSDGDGIPDCIDACPGDPEDSCIVFVDDDNCPGPGDGSELNPYCSIQTAIDNAELEGDEIVVAPGVYLEALDLLGKAITLRSSGGPDVTVIDAQGTAPVVTGAPSGSVIEGFTITGSTGAGILLVGGGSSIRNCRVLNNGGGGIIVDLGGTVFIEGCVIHGNGGTGVDTDAATIRLSNSVLSSNGGRGVSGNVDGYAELTNCVIMDNDKGGIHAPGYGVSLTNCVIANNSTTGSGGGIHFDIGDLAISNSLIWGNTAAQRGGGIYVSVGAYSVDSVTIHNSIVTGNYASEGPQMAISLLYCYPFEVANSNFEGGKSQVVIEDPAGANCIDLPEWTNNIDADPMFVDPYKGDFRLMLGSPCIDAANNEWVPVDITTDLDGNPRFLNTPGVPDCPQAPGQCGTAPVVDMGAYEFVPYRFVPW